MSSPTIASVSHPGQPWRDLYLKALFETDQEKILGRIKDAEKALLLREHELFTAMHCVSEREAINTALKALYVLGTSLQLGHKLAA